MLEKFAPDGYKDEPNISTVKNSFMVKFEGTNRYNKTFKTLQLAKSHRDEKAKEFGVEENVANKRIQNRLRSGKGGDEDARFTSALEFLKARFPLAYSSMDEKHIYWNAPNRQWVVSTPFPKFLDLTLF